MTVVIAESYHPSPLKRRMMMLLLGERL